MRYAIVSDIHGNLEALTAVLHEIDRLGVERVICLGDLVCYGADSLECVRRSSAWEIVISGDWDAAMVDHDPASWNSTLNRHIEYVRGEIQQAADSKLLLETIKSFLPFHVESGIHFVHGTPDNPREWIFPEDVYDSAKLNRIAGQFDDVCFCGHAHINGVFRRSGKSEWSFTEPKPGEAYGIRQASKTIVTVGSVGQPRDDNPGASFVTLKGDCVTFHRIEYDVEAAADKIRANPDIDNMYGDRLIYGR